MKRKIVLILLGLVVLGSGVVLAGKGYDKKGGGHGEGGAKSYCKKGQMGDVIGLRWERIADKLDLTDEQKKKIRRQKHETAKAHIKNSSELKLEMLDLKYELDQEEINDKKVDGLVDEISKIQKRILKNRISSLKKMKAVFTKEQWKKIRDFKMMKRQHTKEKFFDKKKRK